MGSGFLAITTITLALLVRTLLADIRRSALVGTGATATLGVSWLLFALEGLVPDIFTVLGANLFYLLAIALVNQSIRLLDGERPNRWLYLAVVLPAILATLAARYVVDAYTVRVVVMSLALGIILALSSVRLFRTSPGSLHNPGRRAAAYWLSTTAALLLVRAIVTIAQGEAPPFMSQQVVPNLSVALSVVIALGAVFAYFLLFSGRVTAELAADDFKSINDKWGHHAGDVALKAIAHGIRLKVRQYDLVARLGGDEFVVLLPGLGKTAVAELAPRLMESITKQRTDHPGGVNVSIGVSCLEPTPESVATPALALGTLTRLMKIADGDMYGVKNSRF